MLFFLFPHQAFAVEYEITNVTIEAYLQEDGSVVVTEQHTYEFDGDFNGITREIIPKQGAKINDFQAIEGDRSLKIEREDDLYKIHRKGADESITVTLQYVIENGLEVYPDVVQFYWPFFDSRNESSYGNVTIVVHPPNVTDDVIAFGYDEAFQKERIQSNGIVTYHFGYVSSGKNGDIRVAYDAELFPNVSQTSDQLMKSKILEDQHKLIQQAEQHAQTKENFSIIASILIPAFTLFYLFLMVFTWRKAHKIHAEVDRKMAFLLPKQIMSIPATIYFSNNKYLPPQVMAAALLDLVRQGYARKISNKTFQLTNQKGANRHENILMEWLFHKIGNHGEFSFEDLTSFTKNKKNHDKYNSFVSKWKEAVKREVSENNVYEDRATYRTAVGLSSLLIAPFIFIFPAYDLFAWMFAAIALFITVIIYAIAYQPFTVKGAQMSYEWSEFKRNFAAVTQNEWQQWSEDDRIRAYIFGLGINQKTLKEKNEELIEAFQSPLKFSGNYSSTDVYSLYYVGPTASSNFSSANQSTSSSSGGSSSGGGAGGGGGGSGAF